MQGIHITSLELENVKKVKAVALEPAAAGLTVIGGRNGAGKTSVLDAIAWALGGEKFRPDAAKRSGSVLDPMLRVQLSNGLTVTRKGPKGALTVTDETGRRSGQQLLNSFIEVLALDLPRFLGASDKERAAILLNLLGLQDQLDALEREERAKYDTRLQTGRDRDQARHHADSLDYYPDAGAPVSVTALTEKLKEAQAENARNRAFREKIGQLEVRREEIQERIR
jgi:DNA repair exonuclease SbcCD ATPase subunit